MLCSLISYAAFISKRFLFYEDRGKLALVVGPILLWLLVQLFAMYLIMQKVGITFVDAFVMKTGNKQTLEKHSGGLIFVSEDRKQLLFSNKAAIIQANPNVEPSTTCTGYWTEEHSSNRQDKKAVVRYLKHSSWIAVDDKALSNQALSCKELFETLTKEGECKSFKEILHQS